MEFSFPSNASYESIDTITFGTFAQNGNLVTFSTTFDVSTETTGDFYFKPTLGGSPGSEIRGVAIRDVCVKPSDGEEFPGYDDPTTPQPALFPETCEPFGNPTGEGLSTWVSWHWYKLNQFFQCQLMIMLNDMYENMLSLYKLIGFFFRWLLIVISNGIKWLESDFTGWLAGYMSNASGSIVYQTSTDTGGGGCDWWNIVCHISHALDFGADLFSKLYDLFKAVLSDVLAPIFEFIASIAGDIFGFIFDFIGTLINIILSFLQKLLGIFGVIRDVIFGLVANYTDATPATIDGLPTCSGSLTTSSHIICWFWWVLDNTILGGAYGALIIPLFTAIFGVLFAIRFSNRIWSMIVESGAAV
jgi:hypothetical protein